MDTLTYEQACERFDELRAIYWRTCKRAAGSWYTRNEKQRRAGAARRLRVLHRRTWAAMEPLAFERYIARKGLVSL